jgi:cytochrome c oxidase subunit 2
MDDSFRLFPAAASEHASQVDALYLFLLLVSVIFTGLIAAAILWFSLKYRRGNKQADRRDVGGTHYLLEAVWTLVPGAIALGIFYWGATLYVAAANSPANALEIQVVGKQWMWKIQHPSGRREINELHVPVGRPVRLNMISEDVIHSMYLPVFRIKRDVLPGSYSSCWFEPTTTGQFHLFCAEYCGTNHSRMTGVITVLEPAEYEAWLAGRQTNETPVQAGFRLFAEFRCNSCHLPGGAQGRCPPLEELYGHEVKLRDGSTVTANDDYLRESILRPQAKIVAGFEPLMPAYESQLNEEQIMQLLAYLRSLAHPIGTPAEAQATPSKKAGE